MSFMRRYIQRDNNNKEKEILYLKERSCLYGQSCFSKQRVENALESIDTVFVSMG